MMGSKPIALPLGYTSIIGGSEQDNHYWQSYPRIRNEAPEPPHSPPMLGARPFLLTTNQMDVGDVLFTYTYTIVLFFTRLHWPTIVVNQLNRHFYFVIISRTTVDNKITTFWIDHDVKHKVRVGITPCDISATGLIPGQCAS